MKAIRTAKAHVDLDGRGDLYPLNAGPHKHRIGEELWKRQGAREGNAIEDDDVLLS